LIATGLLRRRGGGEAEKRLFEVDDEDGKLLQEGLLVAVNG
jgi:hypothetical protein